MLDTAAFDVDAMTVQLVWRGAFEVSDEDAPEIQHVFVSSDTLGGADERRRDAGALCRARRSEGRGRGEPGRGAARERRDGARRRAEALDARARDGEPTRRGARARPASPPTRRLAPPNRPTQPQIAESSRRAGASEEDVAELLAVMSPSPPRARPSARRIATRCAPR